MKKAEKNTGKNTMTGSQQDAPSRSRGRIEIHGEGLGVPSEETVEQRAAELARIAGRAVATAEDRRQAQDELQATRAELSTDDASQELAASTNPQETPEDTGRMRPRVEPDDARPLTEQSVKEGVREAEHDRMLQARRQNQA